MCGAIRLDIPILYQTFDKSAAPRWLGILAGLSKQEDSQ